MKKEESFTLKAEREQEAMRWYVDTKQLNGEKIIATEAPNKYSSFDNWINSGTTEYITECKIRVDYNGNQIDRFGGAMFEHTKLAGILNFQETAKTNQPILYYNFFKDELRIYQINSDPTSYSWYQKKLPKDNFDKTLIWKWVTNLPKTDLIETIKYK